MHNGSGDSSSVHWTIYTIGTLSERAFREHAPWPDARSYSVALRYVAHSVERIQIIAAQGAANDSAPGWRLYLGHARLSLVVIDDRLQETELSVVAPSPHRWTRVLFAIDRELHLLRLQCVGHASVSKSYPPSSITPPSGEVIIGGYTDPAGGHFDYTFGREGSGLVDDVKIFRRPVNTLLHRDTATETNPPSETTFGKLPRQNDPVFGSPIVERDREDYTAPADISLRVQVANRERLWACIWDFPDGSRVLGSNITRHFEFGGSYTVGLTLIDYDYRVQYVRRSITVRGQRYPFQPAAVFPNEQHDYACCRIPALVNTTTGNLLAFCEGRVESCSDSTPRIRGLCKRSHDNGHTWEDTHIVARNTYGTAEYSVMNLSPVVDRIYGTGRIVLLYNCLEHTEWELSRGLGKSRVLCTHSTDDGYSWSEPSDITDSIRASSQWRIQRPTLGHAIQMTIGRYRGRILHAGTFTTGNNSVFQSQNYLFYSDDIGVTWHIAGIIPHTGLNEATLAEVDEGTIIVNSRSYRDDQRPVGCRALTKATFRSDGSIHLDSTYHNETLVDSGVQASMLSCSMLGEDNHVLLFANPANPHARRNLTVRFSRDKGSTWPVRRAVILGASAYSDLVHMDDGCIGVIYEAGNTGGIHFLSFSLEWLTGQKSC